MGVLKSIITYTADEPHAEWNENGMKIHATIRSKNTSCKTNSLDNTKDNFERNN